MRNFRCNRRSGRVPLALRQIHMLPKIIHLHTHSMADFLINVLAQINSLAHLRLTWSITNSISSSETYVPCTPTWFGSTVILKTTYHLGQVTFQHPQYQ